MTPDFADPSESSIPLHVLQQAEFDDWLKSQPEAAQSWITTCGFTGAIGQALVVPGSDGHPSHALAGYGTEKSRTRARFHLAAAAAKLPKGAYHIVSELAPERLETEALGWLLASYRYDTYRDATHMASQLAAPEGIDADTIKEIAKGEFLTRDLINTPANDMGPEELESAARVLAETHGASISVVAGDDLLDQNFPLIHTVGRASNRSPRLIDISWGHSGPQVVLVGKGVCFDTGGLNLKPGGSMALMKKDMGGAANVLGLGHMLMATNRDIRLRILIPAVENAVSGNAFRPGDVLRSRKGLSVEINNTDAEGRLVLADALTLAQEADPDLIVSMATLTGAARVAVGPDLAPYYCDDNEFVHQLETSARATSDPVWRMPFHSPYETMIEPGIADLDNAPKGGFAGSITAALFLRRFVEDSTYAHFDIYGWNPSDAPGRSKGGVGQGTRALFDLLQKFEQR